MYSKCGWVSGKTPLTHKDFRGFEVWWIKNTNYWKGVEQIMYTYPQILKVFKRLASTIKCSSMPQKKNVLYMNSTLQQTHNSILLLHWHKWSWICPTDGKWHFSDISVIQLYFCCILYILCNQFYLILKTLYMEIFISCHFTSNVSNSWPVIVYLTKSCCVMEMKISNQTWLCLFVRSVCGLSNTNQVNVHPEQLHFFSLLKEYSKNNIPHIFLH